MAYTTAQIQAMIRAEAQRQGVDPALALGIAQAESSFNIHSVGDNGRSVGLFQLQPAAIIDVGGEPRQRYNVPDNIRYGIAYLKNRLAKEGGNLDRGISAYNQGIGMRGGQLSNPQYVRTVRSYQQRFQQQPSFLSRVGRALSPASAEAAPAAGRDLSQELFGSTPASAAPPPPPAAGRDLSQELFGSAPTAPAPDPRQDYEVDVQVLGPPGTAASQGLVPEAAPVTAPVTAPAATPTLGQNLRDAWQHPLQYARESLTGPIPQEYYAPKPAPDLLGQAGAIAIPTITTAIGAGVLGVPGALGGAYLGRRANVALGLEPEGRLGDVLSVAPVAAPAVWGGIKAAARGITGWSRAGQAIQQADEAARTAGQTYQADQAAYQAQVRAQEAERLQAVEARGQVAQERQAATQQQQQQRLAQRQQQYQQQVQQYEQAVTGQQQAAQAARGLPATYGPETPSRTLYNRFRDLAPEAQVPLTTLQETAAGIQQQVSRGFETVTPTRLQAVLDEVQRLPEVVDGLTAHRLMQDIGPLTRSPNSQIRGAAKQLYAGFQDALEKGAAQLPETAEARQVLLSANRAARREFALDDVQRIFRRATSRTPEGQVRFNAARAMDQLERLYEENALFRGSWTPEDWQGLTAQVNELTQVPRIPARPGAPPEPVTPRTPQEPRIPAGERVVPQTTPQDVARIPARPGEGVPTLTPREHGAFRTFLRGFGLTEAVLTGGLGPLSKVALAAEAKDKLADALAQMMISPRWQPYVRSVMQADGTVNLDAMIALAGGRAALAQQQRGTATPQEAEQAVGTLRSRYAP